MTSDLLIFSPQNGTSVYIVLWGTSKYK